MLLKVNTKNQIKKRTFYTHVVVIAQKLVVLRNIVSVIMQVQVVVGFANVSIAKIQKLRSKTKMSKSTTIEC